MAIFIEILRTKNSDKQYFETFLYEPFGEGDTIATALKKLNEREELKDVDGKAAEKIEWECSCLQKKCGSCAMVINGRPRLACDAKISEFKGKVRVEPLKKFPVVCDLTVDRSILFANLKEMKSWVPDEKEAIINGKEIQYEASRCLQCGCCLEICPNFYSGGKFFGMAAGALTSRLISELPKGERDEIAKAYKKHFYAGCGKSLACKDICPAGIDTEKLLVNSNAVAIWKRKSK